MKPNIKVRNSIFAFVSAALATSIALFVQINQQSDLPKCSYLDPVYIDLLAFAAAVFLILESLYKIFLDLDKPLKHNYTRFIRLGFGFGILALHIMQFLHK